MRPTHHGDDRGQTVLDFAIGMGVFLLTVAFVFSFIPSLTAPFVTGSQADTATADRVATHLVEGQLADPSEPYVLDVECTTDFFDESSNDDCGYANDETEFKPRIGVGADTNVNVTIEHDDEVQCDDGEWNVVDEDDSACDSDGVVYAVGDDPSDADSTTSARRIATVDQRDVTVYVEVW